MGDFLELAARRQSCRSFTGGRVERAKLTKCVEAARLAPSGCNGQPWSFVVVDAPDKVAQVAKCAQVVGESNKFTDKAGAFIVVLEEHAVLNPALRRMLDSQIFAKGDIGGAVVSICIEAAELGIGTCVIGLYDRESLTKILNLPAEQRFGALIAVGCPTDETIRPKIRKPLEEIVRYM
ncbi:MAG: nitroreductase family protein [Synergistaceae bacterium]|jgi:nitroreductase|nr:nitroreductase family protein [Synergistaceae bacterium]